ncbi:MAG: heat-inducible transcription repressor HrcA [Clostridia bacterium]|nr:heat-inducible transcription repressor HrcA [Clostridia bacterium]
MDGMVLSHRKQRILTAVIETYIRTGEPVGSKLLAGALSNAVSSATIRNEMAELAALGLLTQPHTSAGRVPTAPAFRLYIDRLMPRQPLAEESRQDIDEMLAGAGNDPERLVADAAGALAALTGCAAVTTPPNEQDATVRRLELMHITPRMAALVLMTSSGLIRNRLCCFDMSVDPVKLQQLAAGLQEHFAGVPLCHITLPVVQSLVLSFGENGLYMLPLLTALLELAQEAAEAEVTLKGQLNLLRHPDYNSERARLLLGFLSQQELLTTMLASCSGGLRVLLGNESVRPELDGSSLIVTHYQGAGGASGTIGVIGPLRMDYAATIPRIEYLADSLSRSLSRLAE